MLWVVIGSGRTLLTEVLNDDEAALEANLAVAIVGFRNRDDWYKPHERTDPLHRVVGVMESMQQLRQ
jgi:hypothetical protein